MISAGATPHLMDPAFRHSRRWWALPFVNVVLVIIYTLEQRFSDSQWPVMILTYLPQRPLGLPPVVLLAMPAGSPAGPYFGVGQDLAGVSRGARSRGGDAQPLTTPEEQHNALALV